MTMRRSPALVFAGLAIAAATTPGRAASDVDPRVAAIVDSVSADRLKATLQRLESFETRHLLS